MKKLVIIASVLTAIAGSTLAVAGSGDQYPSQYDKPSPYDGNNHDPYKGHPVAAPELDPASAMAALTLLAGGLAVVRGRRRK